MSFTATTRPIAAKHYDCGNCADGVILKGQRHVKYVGANDMTDYVFRSLRLCERCADPDPVNRVTKAMEEASDWNARYPVGTRVRYWTGLREGEVRVSVTRHPAQAMSDHASVWVEGLAGSVALSHVEVIEE